ncbi:hypothetical protein CQY22_003530 [Mycolicibacterium brumae]|uniref:Uncharacterized protein n=2 Tax=Mycolicibacterium brumae TaxID=85968 RepID=A0A2G5PFL4_9MYCO|nr:hypothetical protein CQY22_003530 [Mycolicibacterium brumae]
MQQKLRAFAAAGVSLAVGGAIVALPFTALKNDEVAIPQRTAVYDPASLDSETADLIRTVTENSGYTNGEQGYPLASPPSGEIPAAVVEELRGPDASAPDDLSAVLSNLAEGPQRPEDHHRKGTPPGLAISDAGPKSGDDVDNLLDLVAGIEPETPQPPPGATFEDPGAQTGPTLSGPPGTPDIGDFDSGNADPDTTDLSDGPSNTGGDTNTGQGALETNTGGLTPPSAEPTSISEGTAQKPNGKRRDLASNGESGIPAANAKAGADADKQQSQSSKAATKIVDRVNGAVDKVEKTVKRVLEKLTPKRTATVDKSE